jgi:hypothetical protein
VTAVPPRSLFPSAPGPSSADAPPTARAAAGFGRAPLTRQRRGARRRTQFSALCASLPLTPQISTYPVREGRGDQSRIRAAPAEPVAGSDLRVR